MAAPIGKRPAYRGMLEDQYRNLTALGGQIVGGGYEPWQGVAGGAFATAEDIRLARELNSVAVRRRPVQMRAGLSTRGPRTPVTGSVSVATPAAR